MRRLLPVLIPALAGLALLAPPVSAAGDFATGGGKVGDFAQFEFSAHRSAKGKVSGSGSFKVPGSDRVRFDVECLEVDGNRATLGGPPREDFFGAQFVIFDVEDNGPPSGPTPDRISPRFSGVPATNNCTTFAFVDPLFDVTQGNIVVKDRTP